jgi:diaminopimelate decarboxylase
MSLPHYEKPVLVRHASGLMNKFSRAASLHPQETIDGVRIDELVEEFGSPLFVFSEKTLRARTRELKAAFTRRLPRVRLAWSYKTNYLGGVCQVFHDEGAWAEVVSGFEYDKARRLSVPGSKIHFNGPDKDEASLRRAFSEGATVHLDNFDELVLAEQVAATLGLKPEVAIRLNFAVEGAPGWSRFGFHLESGQAMDAARRVVAGDRLVLTGLHTHVGTFIIEPRAYRDAAEKIARFAKSLREDLGIRVSFLDLGGGFASHNTLKAQYLMGDQATPSFDQYADAVVEGLAALEVPPDEMPTLVLEEGRALVDDAGFLITSVRANKRLPDGRRAVVVDAGVNILFTSFWYNHDVVPAQPMHGMPEATVIYGPLCMNIDVLREHLLLPPLNVGDRLVMRNVGAYNVTQWMQFITLRPAVVMVGPDRKHALLRRAETLDDVVGPEVIPPWL